MNRFLRKYRFLLPLAMLLQSCVGNQPYEQRVTDLVDEFYGYIHDQKNDSVIALVAEVALQNSSAEAWINMIETTVNGCGLPQRWETDTIASKVMEKENGYGRYVNAIIKVYYPGCILYEKLYIYVPPGENRKPSILSWGMSHLRESIHVSPSFDI